MRFQAALVSLLVISACGQKAPPEPPVAKAPAAVSARPAPLPASWPAPPFEVPKATEHLLSNGIPVRFVENHEVPLWHLTIGFRAGGFAEPADYPGLASLTYHMLDEGTGDKTAADISRMLNTLASNLHISASPDGAQLAAAGIRRNLEPTLDLLAEIVRDPAFPNQEWELLQKQRIAAIAEQRTAPSGIANRVFDRLLYQQGYRSKVQTPKTVQAIGTAHLKAFYQQHITPTNTVLIAGGDIDPETLLPLLEAKFGSWKSPKSDPVSPKPQATLPSEPTVFFVDAPGAAQSVIRAFTLVPDRTDPRYMPLHMAVTTLGGTFVARMNMNLREDKGYTYGARCALWNRFGPTVSVCYASVQSDKTGPSLVEFDKELREITSTRPITPKELKTFKDKESNGYPLKFETTDYLLHENLDVWRYSLPSDWIATYLDKIQAVTADQAGQAMRTLWPANRTSWLVVGDKASVFDDLQVLGLPVIELDPDGV